MEKITYDNFFTKGNKKSSKPRRKIEMFKKRDETEWSLKQLRTFLIENGINSRGNKLELYERINDHISKPKLKKQMNNAKSVNEIIIQEGDDDGEIDDISTSAQYIKKKKRIIRSPKPNYRCETFYEIYDGKSGHCISKKTERGKNITKCLGNKIKSNMQEMESSTLMIGRSKKPVTSRRQMLAISYNQARKIC